MNANERQVRALEEIARELKGIGRTLKQIAGKLDGAVAVQDAQECPGTCYMTEEPCEKCSQWNGDDCDYLMRPGEKILQYMARKQREDGGNG